MHWRVSVLTLAVLVLFLVSCKHHKRGMDSLRTVEGIYNAFNCAVRGTSLIFNALTLVLKLIGDLSSFYLTYLYASYRKQIVNRDGNLPLE